MESYMTRINLVPVEELSDQHLMAEYRELPRIIKAVIGKKIHTNNLPQSFCLGKGHVKFFTNKLNFLLRRYELLYQELIFREYNLSSQNTTGSLREMLENSGYSPEIDYVFTEEEINISKQRLIEKFLLRPNWYRWSKRLMPEYYKKFL